MYRAQNVYAEDNWFSSHQFEPWKQIRSNIILEALCNEH